MDAYDDDSFVGLTWTLESSVGAQRFSSYGFSATPSAMFDGVQSSIGGFASGSMYTVYQPIVVARQAIASPLVMSAGFGMLGLDGAVEAVIDVDQSIASTNNVVRFFVWLDYPAPGYPRLVKQVLATEPFALTTPGQSVTVSRTFTADPSWPVENIGVTVVVQNLATDEVLQACNAVPDYAARLVVDVRPDGMEADWVLTGPFGFSTTGTDDRELDLFAAGQYTLTWPDIPVWTDPSPLERTFTVAEDETLTVVGQWSDAPFVGHVDGDVGQWGVGARGVALHDADADGDTDIYVTYDDGPNLLLENQGGLVFAGHSDPLLNDAGVGAGAAWADLDNDGDGDLYLVRDGESNRLLRSDGAGGYIDATFGEAASAAAGVSTCWADYDGDGLLDLYVTNRGSANLLLKSLTDIGGPWYFSSVGGLLADAGNGAGAAWADYDNDGDPDLFITNSFGSNKLFQNGGAYGWFDATGTGPLADVGDGAGCTWGDYDNDGDLDLYFANDGSQDALVRNDGGSWSLRVGGALQDIGPGRGVSWGDLDNDGDLDLYLVRHGAYDRFLRNDGGVFVAVPVAVPATAGEGEGLGLGDLDGDGDLDVYVANNYGSSVLLENRMGAGNSWLQLDLTGVGGNVSAVGARVYARCGDVTRMREVNAGAGYLSQNSPRVAFGLGAAAVVDSLWVVWPDGTVDAAGGVPVNRLLAVTRGQGIDVDTAVDGAPSAGPVLRGAYPNPFNPSTTLRWTQSRESAVTLRIYDVSGRLVRTLAAGRVYGSGDHELPWHGVDDAGRVLPAGAYLVRLEADGATRTGRVTLVK